MKYEATIYFDTGPVKKEFPTIVKAAEWLDSENNNFEYTTTIESISEKGFKTGGIVYTERKNGRTKNHS